MSASNTCVFSPSVSVLPSVLALSAESFVLLVRFGGMSLPRPSNPVDTIALFSFVSVLAPYDT